MAREKKVALEAPVNVEPHADQQRLFNRLNALEKGSILDKEVHSDSVKKLSQTERIVVGSTPSLPTALEPSREYSHLYSPELQSRIIDAYIAGASLMKIAEKEGMPSYGTILRWVHEKDSFKEEFERARRVRALHFEEKILDLVDHVEDTHDKDRAAVARLKYDILSWGASVGDATRFGKKTTIEGNAEKPIVFQVLTGVPQRGEVEHKPQEISVEAEVADAIQK